MAQSSGLSSGSNAVNWKAEEAEQKWSGRTTILFVAGAGLLFWGLVIAKAMLLL